MHHNLTPRELDVAKLVVQGLTNPVIAERLGVRPKTVESHLTKVIAKLLIYKRSELKDKLNEYLKNHKT